MNKSKSIYILSILVIILVISQGFTFYFVLFKVSQTSDLINQTTQNLNEKIDNNFKDTGSKIDSLTSIVQSITSQQTSLQKQLGEIKATTSADFSGIIEADLKGVVTIKTNVAQGSGFLITNDGYVVTNAHVLSGARYANVYDYNNNQYSASLIGYDENIDVALLKIKGNFEKLTLGNSDDVKLGQKVIAIGNPLGLSFTTTEGIISARDRSGDNNLPYYFQIDAPLNPGNSGGPLIDTNGDVIGINNFKISGADNIGFALESNAAKDAINQISLQELNQTLIN